MACGTCNAPIGRGTSPNAPSSSPLTPLAAASDSNTDDCAPAPAISCVGAPHCATPGATLQLAGACSAAAGVSLTYLVDGVPAISAVCPSAGTRLTVYVRPAVASKPGCTYNATTSFDVNRERARQLLPHMTVCQRLCSNTQRVAPLCSST